MLLKATSPLQSPWGGEYAESCCWLIIRKVYFFLLIIQNLFFQHSFPMMRPNVFHPEERQPATLMWLCTFYKAGNKSRLKEEAKGKASERWGTMQMCPVSTVRPSAYSLHFKHNGNGGHINYLSAFPPLGWLTLCCRKPYFVLRRDALPHGITVFLFRLKDENGKHENI